MKVKYIEPEKIFRPIQIILETQKDYDNMIKLAELGFYKNLSAFNHNLYILLWEKMNKIKTRR